MENNNNNLDIERCISRPIGGILSVRTVRSGYIPYPRNNNYSWDLETATYYSDTDDIATNELMEQLNMCSIPDDIRALIDDEEDDIPDLIYDEEDDIPDLIEV